MPKKRYTIADYERIRGARASGMMIKEIAKIEGKSSAIISWICNNGRTPGEKKEKPPKSIREKPLSDPFEYANPEEAPDHVLFRHHPFYI